MTLMSKHHSNISLDVLASFRHSSLVDRIN